MGESMEEYVEESENDKDNIEIYNEEVSHEESYEFN